MTIFSTRNIPTQFVVQFLSFSVSTVEKFFGRILTNFWGVGTIGVGKVESQIRMTRFCTRNIPTLFGCNSYSFPSVRMKHTHTFWSTILIVSHQYGQKMFRSNFDYFSGPEHHRCNQSWKPGQDDYVWHSRHTHTFWDAILIVSHRYG